MSELKDTEITQALPEASNNEQQTQEEVNLAAQEPQLDEIPEKFRGKSALDVIKSYNEVERNFHKISSERAEEKRQRESLDIKVRELEARLNSQPSQASKEQQEEVDPLKLYEEEFDSDPKTAIKNLTKRQMEKEITARRQAALEADARMAAEFYNQQKKDNQDFAKLEPKMQAIAQEYADLVNPEKINSVKALKLLHLAARGASVEDYVAEASSRAKKEGATIRQEKQQAYSEGTRSEGQKTVAFKDLSLEEMEKALGRAD
jgi:hypothetical protein